MNIPKQDEVEIEEVFDTPDIDAALAYKREGNTWFGKGEYDKAYDAYTNAINVLLWIK